MPEDPAPDHDPLAFMEGAQSLLEVCVGYRTVAETNGFSSVVAEQMALQLHSHLLAGVFAKKGMTR